MILTHVSRIMIGILLVLILQVAWSDSEKEDEPVLKEYYRLLHVANDGSTEDKLALFTYTVEHPDELGKYAGTVLTHLAEASTEGNGQASFWIGHMAEKGIWIDQSDQGAMIYYVLAAQQGSDKGMHASVSYFAKAASNATSKAERELALKNAQKWYDALIKIRDESESLFKSARYNYALGRLKFDSMDVYGMTLLSEAALEGHAAAASSIRNLFAMTSTSDYEGNDDATQIYGIWKSTIDVIGLADEEIE